MSLEDITTIPLKERNRKTGIDAVGAVPWGMHLCCFYDTKQDLLDILVPYFKAGLENNESCIWVTSKVLSEKEAKKAMTKAVPDFTQYLERGQIEIVPYNEWYFKDGVFNGRRVLNSWIDKLNQALDKGYDGMRLTGNTSWLEEKYWADFTEYEEEVDNVIGKYHMLAICTYPLGKCGASEVIDVMSRHQSTLTRQAGDWVLTRGSGYKRAEEALTQSEEKYRNLFELSPVGITTLDMKGVITSCNPAVYRDGGYSPEEFVGKHFTKIAPLRLRDIPKFIRTFSSIIRGKIPKTFEVEYNRKDGTTGWTEIQVSLLETGGRKLGVQVLQRDITERKRAEESQELASAAQSREPGPLTPLQKRFIKSGLEGFNDKEVVELLLSLCPSGRQRQIRERASKVFKNVRELLSASPQELQQAGLPPLAITYIRLLHDIPAEVLREKIVERLAYASSQEIFDYLYYSMRDLKKEVFKVIYLNKRDQIIDVIDLFEGTLDIIPIRPREIVDSAIKHNASFLIFVHNHPSGDPTPSKTDKQLTRDLVFIGNILQIRVLDHIIIGEDRYFSFADDGLIQKYEDEFLNIRIRRI